MSQPDFSTASRVRWYPSRRYMNAQRRREIIAGYTLIFPALVLFCIFVMYPMVDSFVLSFTNKSLVSSSTEWIGFKNYSLILNSPLFWQAFLNTVLFSVQVLPLNIIISLCLAMLVYKKFRGVGVFRTIFYTPVITSMVAVSVVWLWIWNPSYGFLNSILAFLHLPTQSWLVEPHYSLEIIVLLRIWKGVGANMVIFIAGLNTIPRELLDAAEVDGARGMRRFWSITWPLLQPTMLYVIVLGTISLFQAFSEIYVMTQGGPVGTSTTLVYLLFQQGFQTFDLGYAAAIAVVLFIIIFGLSLFNLTFVQRRMRFEY